MKKMLAILLSAVMVLALLAGCGSKDNEKNKDSDTQGGDASALNVAVFYYDFSDVYISSVRNSILSYIVLLCILYTYRVYLRGTDVMCMCAAYVCRVRTRCMYACSPFQQRAVVLREQVVDLNPVALIDANFPDGGGHCGAVQLRQVSQRQQLLYPRQGQRIVLRRTAQLVQLGLQRLFLRIIVGAVAEEVLFGDKRVLIVLVGALPAALDTLQGGFQFLWLIGTGVWTLCRALLCQLAEVFHAGNELVQIIQYHLRQRIVGDIVLAAHGRTVALIRAAGVEGLTAPGGLDHSSSTVAALEKA